MSTTFLKIFSEFFQAIAYNTYITSQWTRDYNTPFPEVANSPGRFFSGPLFARVKNPTLPPTQFFFGRAPHSLSPTAVSFFLLAPSSIVPKGPPSQTPTHERT